MWRTDRDAVAANRRDTRLRVRQPRGLLDPCLKRDRPAGIPRPQARQSDRPLARRSGERRFDDLVDERRKSRVVSARRNDQRKNESVLRRRDAPAAGETGQVRPRARLRRRQSISAALGRSVEPRQAAAGEHRIDASRGGGEACDPDVVSRRPDFADRRHRDAQVEMKFLTREGRHRLKRPSGCAPHRTTTPRSSRRRRQRRKETAADPARSRRPRSRRRRPC